jgi:hypothetical protein
LIRTYADAYNIHSVVLWEYCGEARTSDPACAAGSGTDEYEIFVLSGHRDGLCLAENKGGITHGDGGYASRGLVDQDDGVVHARPQ